MTNKCVPQEIIDSLKERARAGQITAADIAAMLPTEKEALRGILESFVTEKLGVRVKPEEVKVINEISAKIDAAQKKLGTEIGNPKFVQENIEFFKAKKEMDDYLQSRSPSNRIKVATSTIGRGMMLASVKSPVLNIGSNIEVGFAEMLTRRAAIGQLRGADNGLAIDYVKMVNKVYQASGYDISRMMSLSDPGAIEMNIGQRLHTRGPGATRRVGQVLEDVVFKQLMGAPDVAFSSAHFADSVNLSALKMTKGDKVQARELMLDSMRATPQTTEGEILKAQGVLDAQKATWTDTSWASELSIGIRQVLNNASGDARLGDYFLPFIKTNANWIATGMDYGGMSLPSSLIDTYKAFKTGDLGSRAYRQKVSRNVVRAGLGLVAAYIITSQLDDEDFMGAYDPARQQIEQLRNSSDNVFRAGGRWNDTAWLGPLAIPVTAIMYARKYGDTPGEMSFQYGKGIISSIMQLPGVSDTYDYVRGQLYKGEQTLAEAIGEARDFLIGELSSRLIPSIIPDIAKALDVAERDAKGAWNAVKARIPWLRETLPERKNIFGETIAVEPGWSVIIFGSRVKTDTEDALVGELSQLSNSVGKGISFTNWDKTSSKTLAQFREKVGQETYDQAKEEYGVRLKELIQEFIDSKDYDEKTDEEKLKEINGLDTDAQKEILKKYKFVYQRAK